MEFEVTLEKAQVNVHDKRGKFACSPHAVRPHMRCTCDTFFSRNVWGKDNMRDLLIISHAAADKFARESYAVFIVTCKLNSRTHRVIQRANASNFLLFRKMKTNSNFD